MYLMSNVKGTLQVPVLHGEEHSASGMILRYLPTYGLEYHLVTRCYISLLSMMLPSPE
jgi:hypothetical protein